MFQFKMCQYYCVIVKRAIPKMYFCDDIFLHLLVILTFSICISFPGYNDCLDLHLGSEFALSNLPPIRLLICKSVVNRVVLIFINIKKRHRKAIGFSTLNESFVFIKIIWFLCKNKMKSPINIATLKSVLLGQLH